MEAIIYDLWLQKIKGVGLRTQKILMTEFGSSKNIYYASSKELLAMGERLKGRIAEVVLKNKDLSEAQKTYQVIVASGVGYISYNDTRYPEDLKEIYDPPLVLYYKGNIEILNKNMIAIVGARKATAYGKYVANELAKVLAINGVGVISGMAYGIDAQAHKGALESAGSTIAVLGCGVDVCYPKSNAGIMKDIIEEGLIVSEFEPGVQPLPQNFPSRNRIISGLSKGVIVVEAAKESGSLITAEFALEQGKDIYAVPGNINNVQSQGTNKLIKEGAVPLGNISDIIEELGLKDKINEKFINLEEDEAVVMEIVLEQQPISVEKMLYSLDKELSEINGLLTILEIKDLIKVLPGKIIIAK